jgi:hypothetical protein
MAPNVKKFATPTLVLEARVAQKCVLDGAIPSSAIIIVKWKAKCIFDVAAMLLYF